MFPDETPADSGTMNYHCPMTDFVIIPYDNSSYVCITGIRYINIAILQRNNPIKYKVFRSRDFYTYSPVCSRS